MHSQPWLFVGWFWFVVMLLPVIGLVQVGMQSMADRYTYLPSIGLFIIVAWGMAGIASISSLWRTGMAVGAAGLLLACLLDTRFQLGYWRDNVTLFSRAVEVTGENPMGNYYLGNAFWATRNLDEAAKNYRSALRIAPHLEEAYYQLGCVLLLQKKSEEAGDQFDEVLRLNYDNVDAHVGLGNALAAQRKYAEAEAEYSNALVLRPDDAAISKALAVATLKAESGKALTNFYEILKVQPTPEVHIQIAAIQTIQGNFQEAMEHYLAALQLKPDSSEVLNNLAWFLTTCPDAHIRDGAQAVKYAERACELTYYRETMMVGTLAAAYAEAGRFDDAISMAQKACSLATGSGKPGLLKRNQDLLALYLKHQPYREMSNPNEPDQSASNRPPNILIRKVR
jgi:tetratricopeptide (TPR) repeat protein